MKRSVSFYNVFFPIWLLWLVPISWIFVIPINFIIDSLFILFFLSIQKTTDIFKKYKLSIFKVFIYGFISDFLGVIILMLFGSFLEILAKPLRQFTDPTPYIVRISNDLTFRPLNNIVDTLIYLIAIFISGLFIYHFNLKHSFKKLEMSIEDKKKLAIRMAIFTAPYFFLIPLNYSSRW